MISTSSMSAAQVLDAHWDGKLPVSVESIAARMGVRIEDFQEPCTLSGQIEMKDGVPIATINRTEAPVRQRFTIAHELGHYALGHLKGADLLMRDPVANFSSEAATWKERQANGFAARLLMPEKTLRYAVDNKNILSVARLATIFDVSQAAMRYRLQNMGLIRG